MNWYFPKPYRSSERNVKVELDLSSYPTKVELKNAAGVGAYKLAAKSDLASPKTEVYKSDVDKLKAVFIDLS